MGFAPEVTDCKLLLTMKKCGRYGKENNWFLLIQTYRYILLALPIPTKWMRSIYWIGIIGEVFAVELRDAHDASCRGIGSKIFSIYYIDPANLLI